MDEKKVFTSEGQFAFPLGWCLTGLFIGGEKRNRVDVETGERKKPVYLWALGQGVNSVHVYVPAMVFMAVTPMFGTEMSLLVSPFPMGKTVGARLLGAAAAVYDNSGKPFTPEQIKEMVETEAV